MIGSLRGAVEWIAVMGNLLRLRPPPVSHWHYRASFYLPMFRLGPFYPIVINITIDFTGMGAPVV